MTTPSRRRAAAIAAALMGLVLLLAACSAATADQGAGSGGPATSAGDVGPHGPGPSDRPDPALSGQPVPTLPPGDPGTGTDPDSGDDSGDDHGGDKGGDHADDHGQGGVITVPAAAVVDADTVGALAGGSWTAHSGANDGAERCSAGPPEDATASRTLTLVSADGGLVQTVSAHESVHAARDAVETLAERLGGCGFTTAGDPRLGEASAQLTRSADTGEQQRAVIIAAEGATVLLLGTGSATADGVWESLADVALGTACAASVHGCH